MGVWNYSLLTGKRGRKGKQNETKLIRSWKIIKLRHFPRSGPSVGLQQETRTHSTAVSTAFFFFFNPPWALLILFCSPWSFIKLPLFLETHRYLLKCSNFIPWFYMQEVHRISLKRAKLCREGGFCRVAPKMLGFKVRKKKQPWN